jgi:hypothetical protein
MITEDALADLFEKAVQDLDPAVHAIVTGAERRGRRLRTRRRAWLALGSGLVVAALAGTALAAGVPLTHPGGAQLAAGPASRHPSPKHTGTGHASPKPSGRRVSAGPSQRGYPQGPPPKLAPGYQMTIGQMLDVLRRLLPPGSTLSNVNPYAASDGTLEVDYNDGQGAVDLIIAVSPTATYPSGTPLDCPKPLWTDEGSRPAGALPISCVTRTLPDRSIERDAVMYADVMGFYGYNIYDQRPDGITVFIQVGNGINHTLPQVDRARPPGTLAGWEAVVENPAWHLRKGWHLES